MRRFILGLVLALMAAGRAGAGAGIDPGEAAARIEALRSASLATIIKKERRILRIGDRLRRAGVDLCLDEQRLVWGVVALTERERVELGLSPWKSQRAGSQRVEILWVEPGSPADRAGLAVGEVIEKLDGTPLKKRTDLYRRIEDKERQSVRVTVRSGTKRRVVSMPLVLGCFTGAGLSLSDSVNAFKNHHGVYLHSGMLRLMKSDHELAVVVGHELGHGILQTGSKPHYEADADYIGLYLMARAGYDVEVAPGLWRRLAVRNPHGLIDEKNRGFRTHPRTPSRTLALEATISEIREKQTAGSPLEPEVPE